MADRPRFGPAGIPPLFRFLSSDLSDVPKLLRQEGLDAFEYEAVHWGKKPQIKREHAERIAIEAKRNDVWVSMHGSYYINLCGSGEVTEASKSRLVACAVAAEWMKAHVVVFHMGFYGEKSKEEVFGDSMKALGETVGMIGDSGVKNVNLGLETSGKPTQFGTLDEVLGLCERVEHTQPVLDWAHLYAMSKGRIRGAEDFRKVVDKVESRLGRESAENLHCHFSKIEFSGKGERRHHILDEEGYGPDFSAFADVIVDLGLKPVIICETALLDIDALTMRKIFLKKLEKRKSDRETRFL
jgi:deoxyribonuclease-4